MASTEHTRAGADGVETSRRQAWPNADCVSSCDGSGAATPPPLQVWAVFEPESNSYWYTYFTSKLFSTLRGFLGSTTESIKTRVYQSPKLNTVTVYGL